MKKEDWIDFIKRVEAMAEKEKAFIEEYKHTMSVDDLVSHIGMLVHFRQRAKEYKEYAKL